MRRDQRHEMLGFAFEKLQQNIKVRWDVLTAANAENAEPRGDVLALKNRQAFFSSPPNPNEMIRRRGEFRENAD